MTTKLLDSAGRYDRAAIMRDAHRRFRDGRRLGLGWTFGQCLSTAWAAARLSRAARIETPPAIETRRSSSLARPMTFKGALCASASNGRERFVPGVDLRMGGLAASDSRLLRL